MKIVNSTMINFNQVIEMNLMCEQKYIQAKNHKLVNMELRLMVIIILDISKLGPIIVITYR